MIATKRSGDARLARTTAWRIALQNLALALVLFIASVCALNVFLRGYVFSGIDARMQSELQGFVAAQQDPEERSIRPPRGLLPVIYYRDDQGAYRNPFPASYAAPDDYEAILGRNVAEGFGVHRVEGRTYRVYRVDYDRPLVFRYDDADTAVTSTVSFVDISNEMRLFDTIGIVSFFLCTAGGVFYGGLAFVSARRTIAPIEAAWTSQRMLLADASHEMRNPLAGIKANAELLLRNPDKTILESAEEVSRILEGTDHMSSMLSNLLTLARADAGNDELAFEDVDLGAVLAACCRQFKQIAEALGVEMSADIAPGLHVEGDAVRLREMFDVLLDNAVRYTPAGGRVTVSLVRGKKKVVAAIADTGIGIAPEDLRHVFKRFHRTQRSRELYPEGTGLGLPLARWIAERHRAVFDIRSEEGEGTVVKLKFDAAPQRGRP